MPIIKKTIETSIDLMKPSEIYASNISKVLMEKLTERYVGKCYNSVLIDKIDSIIKYSDTRLTDNRLDGSASIDVQFVVEGLVLTQGELLTGCKVLEINNNGVIISHPKVCGLIKSDAQKPIGKILKKDQMIPVLVVTTRYDINNTQITIRGVPYVPSVRKNVYYNITDILSPEETDKLDLLLNELNDEIKKHESVADEKSYKFLEDLVYPFKTVQKYEVSQIGSKFTKISCDLKTLLEIRDGCLIAPEESCGGRKLNLYHSKKAISPTIVQSMGTIVESSMYPAISDCISKKLTYLRNLRALFEQYNTFEKLQDMILYWKLCQSAKE